jgi:integrase/recombinase XerD
LQHGADIRHIQAILGHADLRTTAAYTQVAITELKAVHQRTHPAERDHAPAGSSL